MPPSVAAASATEDKIMWEAGLKDLVRRTTQYAQSLEEVLSALTGTSVAAIRARFHK